MTDGLLTVPEPKIDLYETGFKGVCKLNRAVEGKKLSELVERISEPMVVAVDAPWGAGKSVFLKCWVGAHALENEGTAKTVYFDAFRHDFMDDPLIGLTGVISERLEKQSEQSKTWKTAKQAAAKLARPAVRVGLAMATAGATEFSGAVVDAGLGAGSDELKKASRDFWKKEDGKREAMNTFRETLEKLSADQKLVIVVDELDRCRPDYALNLLEVIKHFFDVPNVHFVLGVNLKELANSVKARYGAEVQGGKYLQKFITVSMPLVSRLSRNSATSYQRQHFGWVCKQLGLYDNWRYNWLSEYLQLVDYHAGLSLRDVEKIATLAMVTPEPSRNSEAHNHLYAGLLFLQVLEPSFVTKARQGQLTDNDIFSVFMLATKPTNTAHQTAHHVWMLVASPPDIRSPEVRELMRELFDGQEPRDVLRDVIAATLDVFEVIG